MSERLYYGELRKAVEKLMGNPSVSDSIKEIISYHYWAIGHEMADERDDSAVIHGSILESKAKKFGLPYISELAGRFVEVYQADEENRISKRKKREKKRQIKYAPRKTFEEELAKLDPEDIMQPIYFNTLYGELTIPGSRYIFLNGSGTEKRSYIVGEDERSAGEIWKILEESLGERISELTTKEFKVDVDEESCYVGPMDHVDIIVAREILVPNKITEMRMEREKEREKNQKSILSMSAEELIEKLLTIEIPDPYDIAVCDTLKEEGITLGNKTLVDVSAWIPTKMAVNLSKELSNDAYEVLKEDGYRIENLPWLSYGWDSANITQIGNSSETYFGEFKIVESSLPCGRTRSQVEKAWNEAWDFYRKEVKEIENRELNEVEETKIILEEHGISITGGAPFIPCNFREDMKSCAPGACYSGKYVKKITPE